MLIVRTARACPSRRALNPSATLAAFGQELNPESYAICKSDMLIKGEGASNIKFGFSFTQGGPAGTQFDYFLSNPPFGVEGKKVERAIRDEHEELGMSGRFGAGLSRIGDGSLLFLQHTVSKFKQGGQGSRLAIVSNGPPLFTGGAGSGESEVRRWLIENDWPGAIVALPAQLFDDSPIATCVWVVTNRKSPERRGKVQLVGRLVGVPRGRPRQALATAQQHGGGAAEHQRQAQGAGRPRRGQLRLRVEHRLHADRRQQDRRGQAAAQQLDAEVPAGDIAQEARHDAPAAEGVAVGADGVLGAGPAGDVGVGVRRQRGPVTAGPAGLRLCRPLR